MMRAYLQLYGKKIQLQCPYVDTFVRKLYEIVPPQKRARFGKGWLIDLKYYKKLITLVRNYFPKPIISGSLIFSQSRLSREEIGQRRQEHYQNQDFNRRFYKLCQAFGLQQNPTLEELKERYRLLSLRYHPDKGGEEHEMRIINRVYQELRENIERNASIQAKY
jgi:hypothetical protein